MAPSKKIFWLLVVFFSLAVAGYSVWIYRHNSVKPVTYAGLNDEFQKNGVPNFALPLLNGENGSATGNFVKLANLEDQIILINFWASWCAPCQVEFPSLVALAAKYSDSKPAEAAHRLRILTISVDKNFTDLVEFLMKGPRSLPSNFQILADSDGVIAEKYGTHKLPETYIVGRNHKLIRKVIDQQNWTSPGFIDFLEKQMAVKTP